MNRPSLLTEKGYVNGYGKATSYRFAVTRFARGVYRSKKRGLNVNGLRPIVLEVADLSRHFFVTSKIIFVEKYQIKDLT